MLNYPCPWSAVRTSSAQRVYNDHGDCWVFKQELSRHTHTLVYKQIPMRTEEPQLSGDPPESQLCHWPASSIPASPVSSLAPIITTSLCLLYTRHPSPHCHTQITLSIRIGRMVCVCVSVTAGVYVCLKDKEGQKAP